MCRASCKLVIMLLVLLLVKCSNPLNPESTTQLLTTSRVITEDGGLKGSLNWSPDGDRIVYTQPKVLYTFNAYSIDTRRTEEIGRFRTDEEVYHRYALCPDRTKFLYGYENSDLYIADIVSETIEELPLAESFDWFSRVHWSSDALKIALIARQAEKTLLLIFMVPEKIVTSIDLSDIGYIYDISWSSDDQKIAMTALQNDLYSIHQVDIVTETRKVIFIDEERKHSLTWCKGDSAISFSTYKNESSTLRLLMLDEDSVKILVDNFRYIGHLVNPSNTSSLFLLGRHQSSSSTQIWEYNLNSETLSFISDLPDHTYGSFFESFDGDLMVGLSVYRDNSALSYYSIYEGNSQEISLGNYQDESPCWSHNGWYVYFTRNYRLHRYSIFDGNCQSYGPTNIDVRNLEISSSGQLLVYNTREGEIYKLSIPSGNRIELASKLYSYLLNPTLSPHGGRIACLTPSGSIVVFNIQVNNLIFEREISGVYSDIQWSHSMRPYPFSILGIYMRTRSEHDIHVIDPFTGEKLTILEGIETPSACWSHDGKNIAYTNGTAILEHVVISDLSK